MSNKLHHHRWVCSSAYAIKKDMPIVTTECPMTSSSSLRIISRPVPLGALSIHCDTAIFVDALLPRRIL